jgi:predicted permease
MNRNFKKYAVAALVMTGAVAAHAALPAGAAAIATSVGADAAEAAGIGATVLAVVMPLSIGFALLVKFIKKGTRG